VVGLKFKTDIFNHIGNVRVSYFHNGAGIEVLEENNYYPFGLKHEGYNALAGNSAYQYKYNEKELQETGMYDYGVKFYMPDIGRWPIIDGKGELNMSKSPYSYTNNTLFNAIDPDGNLVIFINGQHGGSGGSTEYWRKYEKVWRFNSNLSGGITYRKEEVMAFDTAVMNQLGIIALNMLMAQWGME